MRYHAKNGRITGMDYIRFGTGSRTLIILPGLGDGLRTVKGTALPMAWMYRVFAKDFTVYMFSRKSDLPQGYSTRDMARDLCDAMDALGIRRADIAGVSMGGMIAQWLAIDSPKKVGHLILTVTASRPNSLLSSSVQEWMDHARKNDHRALMASNLYKIYSENYCRKNSWLIPLLGLATKPKSYERFLISAKACISHNAFPQLSSIHAPTLVIGGELDKVLGPEASREIADQIPGAQRKIYPQWGHGLYEEAKDFNQVVLDFILDRL